MCYFAATKDSNTKTTLTRTQKCKNQRNRLRLLYGNYTLWSVNESPQDKRLEDSTTTTQRPYFFIVCFFFFSFSLFLLLCRIASSSVVVSSISRMSVKTMMKSITWRNWWARTQSWTWYAIIYCASQCFLSLINFRIKERKKNVS